MLTEFLLVDVLVRVFIYFIYLFLISETGLLSVDLAGLGLAL